jgi:hypothetical protein
MDSNNDVRTKFNVQKTTFSFVILSIATASFYMYHWAIGLTEVVNKHRQSNALNKNLLLFAVGLQLWSNVIVLISYELILISFDSFLIDVISVLMFLTAQILLIVFAFSAARELKLIDGRLSFSVVWLIFFNVLYLYYRLHNFENTKKQLQG